MRGWIFQSKVAYKEPTYESKKLIKTAADNGIELSLHDPRDLEIIVTREDRKSVIFNDIHTALPDFIMPRMGAKTTYFALAVFRHLERLNVTCVNSTEAIETVKDKLYQLQILAEHFPVPKTMLAKFPVKTKWVRKHIGFPVVVKALSGMQGSGVFLSENESGFEDLMQLVEMTNSNFNMIFQEYISSSHGKDLRVFVVGDKVVGAMERFSTDENFKANYSRGGGVKPFTVNSELEELVLNVTRELNLEIAGVDLLFGEDGFKICEVNSSPGFKGLENATGKDIAQEIILHMKQRVPKAN